MKNLGRDVEDLDSLRLVMDTLKDVRDLESGINMEIVPLLDMCARRRAPCPCLRSLLVSLLLVCCRPPRTPPPALTPPRYALLETYLPSSYLEKDEVDQKTVLRSSWTKVVVKATQVTSDIAKAQVCLSVFVCVLCVYVCVCVCGGGLTWPRA